MFKSFIRAIGFALAALIAQPIAFAAAAPLEVLRQVAKVGQGEYTMTRLHAELRHMASADDERTVMRSDLRREGHGFRMCKADNFERLIYAV